MKTYDKVWKPVGALLGTLTGYLYWHEVGCLTGHCPIQSHWESMSIWGGISGMLVADLAQQVISTVFIRHGNTKKSTF